MKTRNIELLVCDLDNTLFDWVEYFVPSFYAMIDKAVDVTKWDREKLLDDIRNIHRKHHDSEHPFALLETSLAKATAQKIGRAELRTLLNEAFHAFNSQRIQKLRTYPQVHETLSALADRQIKLVAHTESKLHAVVDRMRRLDLEKYFSKIYCRERAIINHPENKSFDDWAAEFPREKIVELSHHQRKPDTTVLYEICESQGVRTEKASYIGDSIPKDIAMAKHANIFAIWAAYGARHRVDYYDMLVRISHWTPEDVERERQLADAAQDIRPDFIAEQSISEILPLFGLSQRESPRQYANSK